MPKDPNAPPQVTPKDFYANDFIIVPEAEAVSIRKRLGDSRLPTPEDVQALMADMNRPMDRRRAVEGHLMRVRGQLRLLRLDELVEG